jgi:hypothetical protein
LLHVYGVKKYAHVLEDMPLEFEEFDAGMIHEQYSGVVSVPRKSSEPGAWTKRRRIS